MKILFKHFAKHKLLLVRSTKAIGVNLIKLFLLDKILMFVPLRFRMLCKVLIMFGYKFTLLSTIFGVIYSIIAEIFNWTFNYKTIIDLILGLVLSYETGLFSELKFLWDYYYTKFFDWWISKVEVNDKEKAKSLRQRIFKPSEHIEISPIDPKEKARMDREYMDKIRKQVKENRETWHDRMERQIREIKDKNINLNITPDYNNSKSWFSYNTLKWLMYSLIAAGVLYSYYHFLSEVNSYLYNQFLYLYNTLKDIIQNPVTYLASLGSYLWLNTKSIIKSYILRKIWPLSWFFKPKSFTKDEIDDTINDPDNKQGEDNFPSSSMRDLIHTDMPDMTEAYQDEIEIKPDYNSSKYHEEMDQVVKDQDRITQRWNESPEEFVERRSRIEKGKAKETDIGSVSETMSEARNRLFQDNVSSSDANESSLEEIDEGKATSVGLPTKEDTAKAMEDVNRSNLYYLSQLTEQQYFNNMVQPLLDDFIEKNLENNNPRIKAFIKWTAGEASNLDIEIVIGRRLPNLVTDAYLNKEYFKVAYEILNVTPQEEVIEKAKIFNLIK